MTELGFTLASPFLSMAAKILDDTEGLRISNENRLRQLTRSETDTDGEERGFGLMPRIILEMTHVGQCGLRECKSMEGKGSHGTALSGLHQFRELMDMVRASQDEEPGKPRMPRGFVPHVWHLAVITDSFLQAEQRAIRNLEQLVREHPLWEFFAPVGGVGAKQFARLLASIGDPYIRPEILRKQEDGTEYAEPSRPRTRDELKSLCGYGLRDVLGDDHELVMNGTEPARAAPRRQKGVAMNWSGDARQRTWLITSKVVMQLRRPCTSGDEVPYATHVEGCTCSVLRLRYDLAREKLMTKTHAVECSRCAPKGQKAPPGSPLGPAHAHLRAQREVAQVILRMMWRHSRDLYWAYIREHPEADSPDWLPEVRKMMAEHESRRLVHAGVTLTREAAAERREQAVR